eukprot:SAG31_NODE_59_length_29571_cov_20.443506_3_plen_271_part_00
MLGKRTALPRKVAHVELKDLRVSSQIEYAPADVSWSNPRPVGVDVDLSLPKRASSSMGGAIMLDVSAVQTTAAAEVARRDSRRWGLKKHPKPKERRRKEHSSPQRPAVLISGMVLRRSLLNALIKQSGLMPSYLAVLLEKFEAATEQDKGVRPGTVDIAGFTRVVLDVFEGQGLTPHLISRLFAAFDTNGDSRIDYRELVLGCGKAFGTCAGGEEVRVRLIFDLYDEDGSGTVTESELLDVVSDRQEEVRSYFLVFVPTIRDIRHFHREM